MGVVQKVHGKDEIYFGTKKILNLFIFLRCISHYLWKTAPSISESLHKKYHSGGHLAWQVKMPTPLDLDLSAWVYFLSLPSPSSWLLVHI